MSCIKIESRSGDLSSYVDRFADSLKVSYYKKGSERRRKQSETRKCDTISAWYGDNDWGPLADQHQYSMVFLARYGHVLDEIAKAIDDLEVYIDYPTTSRLVGDIAVQQDQIPLDLIKLCAQHNVSINIATYLPDSAQQGDAPEPATNVDPASRSPSAPAR